ncbi:probable TPR domain protein [Cephalotrichum gorgonifer]|uniref:Probable TPR domain protein n=1 Tax=Cephalotrichum gorgonifer TaxID=2041049 RepID=A0AAE8N440_9PEZI|nr:probable TPR domain protein [Cephalotrichum gorgonifer]
MASQYPFNLGTYHRHITASNKACDSWFNRGLLWTYSFNHGEAAFCFEEAITSDSRCAMAYWGLAYCLGPNYNKPWSFFDETDLAGVVSRGRYAARLALENLSGATPAEKALVNAIQHRYPDEKLPEDYSAWSKEFADAMGRVYSEFPDDLDVITLYADALMNVNPWDLWDLKTGDPVEGARTLEIKDILDGALTLDGALQHPGLLHMYIHLMEMSPSPESALPVADHLRGLVPDAGHLQHMPTHLDVLCGRYQEAIASNSDAIVADEKFLARSGPYNFYTLYRSHNYHFRVYAAMFAGQFKVSLDTAGQLEATIPKELLLVESPPMADWLEAFVSLRTHVLIRFGRWEDLIRLELPEDPLLYCTTTAITHYAKGVAFAATGRIQQAEEQRRLFRLAVQNVKPSRTLFNNKCTDILLVAESMLAGELEYRRGNHDVAFGHLREAIRREDSLPYDEPWGWMQPTRHAYGALLLERGRIKEALEVYMADLGMNDSLPRALRHPNNVWALHGVHECLVKLGRGEEAREVEGSLSEAKNLADVSIDASCFCRMGDASKCQGSPEAACGANC